MSIGTNHTRVPNLYRPEPVEAPARRRHTRALSTERASIHETWRCGNRACGQWTQPSSARTPGACNHCGEPRGVTS